MRAPGCAQPWRGVCSFTMRRSPGPCREVNILSANYWYLFWLANFALAGSAFVIITLIVLVRGIGDLREMFSRLRHHGASDSLSQNAKHL